MRRDATDDGFFIGYSTMPERLARFVSRVVATIAAGAVVWSILLIAGHRRLEGGTFAFGHRESFDGILVARPYPALVDQDGTMEMLVAPGKHGADALVQAGDGRRVSLVGTKIRRGERRMIEIVPGSVTVGAAAALPAATAESDETAAPVELTGEIVDTKCHLGVMVPGEGRTHRACASLCLRGGVPPALYVRDRRGQSSLLLLVGLRGDRVGAPAAEAAGRGIRVTGFVGRFLDWRVVRTDPASWQFLGSDD